MFVMNVKFIAFVRSPDRVTNYTVSQKTRHPIVAIISSNLNQFS